MTHKDMDLWKLAMEFVGDIYKVTRNFPPEERFGLCNQIRRATISIPSNIAEGAARQNPREMIQFVYISLGSLAEVDTQLEIARNLGFIEDITLLEKKVVRMRCMMARLIRVLKAKGKV